MNIDEKMVELTAEEFEENVEEIFTELALCAEKTSSPTLVLVGGQAGSGKSVLVARENSDLEGQAIIIDQDELRTKYPSEKYKLIHDNCSEREEFLLLKPYMSKLVPALIERAQNGEYNIILESALRSVKSFSETIGDIKKRGYNTKLSILSVPEIEGNISMLTRYCYFLERFGECRRNTRIDPESVKKIRENIQFLDDKNIFDDITVSIRGKDRDSLPIQIYSKNEQPEITPVQAYDMGIDKSYEETKRNFKSRYEEIKSVLEKHNEQEQLKKLDDLRKSFEDIVQGMEL